MSTMCHGAGGSMSGMSGVGCPEAAAGPGRGSQGDEAGACVFSRQILMETSLHESGRPWRRPTRQ